MQGEGGSRQMRADILGNSLKAEMIPFLFKEEETKATITSLAPLVYIPNLVEHVMARLDDLDRFV